MTSDSRDHRECSFDRTAALTAERCFLETATPNPPAARGPAPICADCCKPGQFSSLTITMRPLLLDQSSHRAEAADASAFGVSNCLLRRRHVSNFGLAAGSTTRRSGSAAGESRGLRRRTFSWVSDAGTLASHIGYGKKAAGGCLAVVTRHKRLLRRAILQSWNWGLPLVGRRYRKLSDLTMKERA